MAEKNLAPGEAPEWFHKNIASVAGEFAKPLTDAELCLLVHVTDSRGCGALRAAAEIKRLRAEKAALEARLSSLRDAMKPHTDLGIPAETVGRVSYLMGEEDDDYDPRG